MMNNKLFIPALVLLLVGMVSCKPDPVDVFETSHEVAQVTLVGADSVRSGAIVSGLDLKVVEYKFLPNGKAVRTETTVGDGVYKPVDSLCFASYVMEYTKNYVGMNVTFTPEDAEKAPVTVFFNENMLIENGTDTLSEQMAKVAHVATVMEALPNTTWFYKDSTLWIDTTKVDTIVMKVIKNRVPGPNGKPIWVNDTTYDTLKYDIYDTIGIRMYTNIELTVNRNEKGENTGHYFYNYYETSKQDTIATKIDSISVLKDYDFRWGLYSITTARRFGLRTLSNDEKKLQEDFSISLYDLKKGTMKVGGTTEFQLKK